MGEVNSHIRTFFRTSVEDSTKGTTSYCISAGQKGREGAQTQAKGHTEPVECMFAYVPFSDEITATSHHLFQSIQVVLLD